MTTTRIKICGITSVDDALAAAAFGADAIGLVFAAKSPRRIDAAAARAIADALPPFVARVGLFMDASHDHVAAILRAVPLDVLQFHGGEDAAFCRAFARRYVKVLPMATIDDVSASAHAFPDAAGFVLDGHGAGEAGGSGVAFDWTRVPHAFARPLILAGGLTADNVARAVTVARPYGVDVSSGIEGSPGRKDHARMRRFIDEVRRVGGNERR